MGQAELIGIFEYGSGIHDEPEFRAFLGSRVGPDVIAETVVQLTHRHGRIDGKVLAEIRGEGIRRIRQGLGREPAR